MRLIITSQDLQKDNEINHTNETLKDVVSIALLYRTADYVQQMSIAVTITGAQVTLSAVDATCSFPPTCARLQ